MKLLIITLLYYIFFRRGSLNVNIHAHARVILVTAHLAKFSWNDHVIVVRWSMSSSAYTITLYLRMSKWLSVPVVGPATGWLSLKEILLENNATRTLLWILLTGHFLEQYSKNCIFNLEGRFCFYLTLFEIFGFWYYEGNCLTAHISALRLVTLVNALSPKSVPRRYL